MYTQDELNTIVKAQKLVDKKSGYLFVYTDCITMDHKQFMETFNPEDCTITKPWTDCRAETEVSGLTIRAHLERNEVDSWIRRWEG